MSALKIVYVVSTLLFVFKWVECGVIRRFNYDARLYEHYSLDSRYIQYSRTEPSDWLDLDALIKARNFTYTSMICTLGPGAWIFYSDPGYVIGDHLMYYLVIGEHCVRADDVESIRPLGKMDELMDQGIVLFKWPLFAGTDTVIMADEGSGEAGSLIFTGGTSFVIEGGGQKVCLRPGLTVFEDGYCLVPNLKAAFGMEGSITVSENCTDGDEGSDEKKLVVQNCYLEGVHEIYVDPDLSIDDIKEVCSAPDAAQLDFKHQKFSTMMYYWGLRLGTDLQTTPVFVKPENEVKLAIIWAVLEIFKESCTNVDDVYIYLLGHFFADHLKALWNAKGNDTYGGTATTAEQWDTAKGVFEFCTEHQSDIKTYEGACKSGDQFSRLPDVKDGFTEEDTSWFEIAYGDDFDPVIEQIWLIINFVLPSCSLASGYINNDWSDLVLLFHQNYLDPLQEIWANPGGWRRIYSAVFHGYDMREVHKDIVACLKGALQASPNYDPIGRPKSFRKFLIYHFKTPDHGKIDKPDLARAKRGRA